MTAPDSDQRGPQPRSGPDARGPIIDLEPGRIKDETHPAAAQASSGQDAGEHASPESAVAPDAVASPVPESAAPARPPVEPIPARGRRGPGWTAVLAASLLGGVAGAALTAAGERWWRPYFPDPLEARLAQVEQRPTVAPGPDLGPVDRRLAALEAGVKNAADQARAADERAGEAAKRAAEADQRAAEALNRPVPAVPAATPPDPAPVEHLTARLDAVETELRQRPRADPDALADLDHRVRDLEGSIQAAAKAAADASAGAAQARQALEGRLAEGDRRMGETAARLASLGDRLGEFDKRSAAGAAQVGQVAERLSGLAQQVATLRRADDAERAASRLTVATAVSRALADGEPYAPALGALRRLGADPGALAKLEPFAAGGAPTAGALAAEFRPIAERLRSEARSRADAEAGEGWDRLRRIAGALVTVRPAPGESASGAGPKPDDPVAEVEAALARRDVAAAAKAFDALPENSRSSAAAFGTKLKALAAADEARRQLTGEALAGVGASNS